MSTPRDLALPAGVSSTRLAGPMGQLAVLAAAPVDPIGSFLLLPGFTGSKEDLLPVIAPLAAAGYAVMAIDLPGQFESSGPDDSGAYGEVPWAEVVTSLAVRMPGPVHLLGHSMGGLIAARAVLRSPGTYASLTLLASGPGAIPEHKRADLRPLIAALPHTPMSDIWAVKQAADVARGWRAPDLTIHDFVARRFIANNPHALRAMAELLCQAPDRTRALRAAAACNDVRVLVMHGENDDAWSPQEQHEMADALGAGYEVIAGVGHSPAVEDPDATARALLDRLSDIRAVDQVRCVGAVLRDAGRVLLVQRGHEPAAGQWSIPGGRVEAGESDAAAVVREVGEETGLRAHVVRELGTVRRPGIDAATYEIHDYEVNATGTLAVASDAADARWFTRAEAIGVPTTEGLLAQLDEWDAWGATVSRAPGTPRAAVWR